MERWRLALPEDVADYLRQLRVVFDKNYFRGRLLMSCAKLKPNTPANSSNIMERF